MGVPTDITLYTAQTPNGIKISILLEELGLEYKTQELVFSKMEQKAPSFLAVNPNGRIPAITDTWHDGSRISIFESGAIMQYLVDRYDTEHLVSYPTDSKEHWEVTSWLMWQMGGLGPMQGQSNHFKRYAKDKIQYGIDRYRNESRRLYRVMDTKLASSASGFLVGDRLTLADIACWGWVAAHSWSGIDIEEFPELKKWLYRLLERPGFERGRNVPQPHTQFDNNRLTDEELDLKAKGVSSWILQSMEEEKK